MQRSVHVILTTHWDREWIQSMEEYRYRLVRLMDKLLDILEREQDLVFVADGQTIMLEDYLAVRPDQQPRLQALARAGRLVFGPWYVLADQFIDRTFAREKSFFGPGFVAHVSMAHPVCPRLVQYGAKGPGTDP